MELKLIDIVDWALNRYKTDDPTFTSKWTRLELLKELDDLCSKNRVLVHINKDTGNLDGLFVFEVRVEEKVIFVEHLISSGKDVLHPLLSCLMQYWKVPADEGWCIMGFRFGKFKNRKHGRTFNITTEFLNKLKRYG